MRALEIVNAGSATPLVLGAAGSTPNRFIIEKLEGIDVPPMTVQTSKSPFQDGETYIDYLYKNRTITVEGAINAPQNWPNIWTYRQELIAGLNPGSGLLECYLYNNSWPYTATKTGLLFHAIAPDSPRFRNKLFTEPFQKFLITLELPDPFFYGVPMSPATPILTDNSWTFTNPGNHKGTLTITVNGPCENPRITDVGSGEFIEVEETLTTGQYITIITTPGQISIVNQAGTNLIGKLASGSTFLMPGAGAQELAFIDDFVTAGTADFVLRPRYLGV